MNCIIVDDDEITLNLMGKLVKQTNFLNLVKKCNSAIEASNILNKKKIDLIFLDNKMPGMTGMEFLETLIGNKPQVIMITSDKESASEAFDRDICDFIIKPVSSSRFLKAVSKAKKIHYSNNNGSANDSLYLKTNSVLININPQDIFLIEALIDYVAIHTFKERYVVHSSMKNMMGRLSTNDFIRVHNSYIVRVDKITKVEEKKLVVNKKTIPISRGSRKALINRLNVL